MIYDPIRGVAFVTKDDKTLAEYAPCFLYVQKGDYWSWYIQEVTLNMDSSQAFDYFTKSNDCQVEFTYDKNGELRTYKGRAIFDRLQDAAVPGKQSATLKGNGMLDGLDTKTFPN